MAHIQFKRWQLSRRHVLRGLGACIPLPWLNAMTSRAQPPTPKRSVFLYIPNGVQMRSWQIQRAGPEFEFTTPLLTLEKHRRDITPISGLHHPGALGKHHFCEKVWLTGAEVSGDGGPFFNGISADQVIAEAHGHLTRLPSLSLAMEGSSLSWNREGLRLPALRDPCQIFRKLFATNEPSTNFSSILDATRQAILQIQSRLGHEDLHVLDEHLTLIRSVERKLSQPAETTAASRHRLFQQLITLALSTDSTRVITCMIGSESHGSPIPELGLYQTRHELSHHHDDPEAMGRLSAADAFLVTQLSHFLDMLKHHRENGLPLLDSTQILWGSGMSCGHSHGTANLPLVLAGGRLLGHRHGSHLDFNLPRIGHYPMNEPTAFRRLCTTPVNPSAQLSNLLETMIEFAGGASARQNRLA